MSKPKPELKRTELRMDKITFRQMEKLREHFGGVGQQRVFEEAISNLHTSIFGRDKMSFIKLFVAMPTDGEGIEKLNADKFSKNIHANVKREWGDDVRVTVEVFDHDGTGEDSVKTSKDIEVDESDFVDAVSDAFCDPTSYDD